MERRPINMLNSLDREPTEDQKAPLEKKRSVFFWVFIALSCVMAMFLVRSIVKSREIEYSTTLTPRKTSFFETVKNFIFQSNNVLEGQDNDRVNILLLGIGGPGHEGPYLSDTNILVSIKPSTNEVALISIPRDLGVKVDGHGWRKINSADAFGEAEHPGAGGDYARQIFEQTFNIKIPYYIRVDFTAFEELIDEVGGVTINVPNSFTDTSYPGPNFSYETIHFDAGAQTMDGKRALIYSRSRHGNNNEGGDFARSRRQQLILEALKAKMLSLGTYADPGRLREIYSSLTSHISTNMNFAELGYLASFAKDISNSKSLVLDSSPGGYLINTTGESGAFILSPKTGNFDTINLAIQDVFEATSTISAGTVSVVSEQYPGTTERPPVMVVSSTKIMIQNGTWIPGLAARIQRKLQDKGYSVPYVSNSIKRPVLHTVIYVLDQNINQNDVQNLTKIVQAASTYTIPEWLLDSYDDPATTEDETGMKYNKDANILIILGTDTKE